MSRTADRILHRTIGEDGAIYVVEERATRALYFGDGPIQSRISIAAPHLPVLSYLQAMTAFMLFHPPCEAVLQIGLGAGSLTHFLWHHFPGAHIDVVECSPTVADLARRFFFLPQDARLRIHIGDGANLGDDTSRRFCSTETTLPNATARPVAQPAHYDLLTIDAFDATGLASGMDKPAFFDACRAQLSDDGILVINLWHDTDAGFARIAGYIDDVFDQQTLSLPVEGKGNVILFAFNRPPQLPGLSVLRTRARALETRCGLPYPRLLYQLHRHNHDPHRALSLHR